MFSKMGEYEACGIFTPGHFILIGFTLLCIVIALKYSYNQTKEEVHKTIKYITIIICILEIAKIIYSISQNSFYAVDTYMPLYYCSILLYAGLLSSFGKNHLKRIGDVSLATGSIVGGIIFIIYPSTSLPRYPAFHILSIYSFLFHGIMIYLGILINKTGYIKLKQGDIKYLASLIGSMGLIALIINNLFDGNLMFITKNFPQVIPIDILYKFTNGGFIYSSIMIIVQMTLPFYLVYYIMKMIEKINKIRQ